MTGPALPAAIGRACARWGLTPDGAPILGRNASLLPVLHAGAPSMLKIARAEEERRGAALMSYWAGRGAAHVLVQDGPVLVMERAMGSRDLTRMAREGQDDAASRILCAAAAALHAPRPERPPGDLVPLAERFRALWPAARTEGGVLADAADAARDLLAQSEDPVVLHGDLHHGNVLDFGSRGWLAIDPKGLVGERGFDFANIFCNPDRVTAATPERFARRLGIVSAAAGLQPRRLAAWVLAYAGLSAAWSVADGEDAAAALLVAALARPHLQP